MIENIDFALVNWSRGQFAMVAFYHWLFIPITLGTTYIIAFAQTIYVKTGNKEWERIAKFWAKLFGINFAIGVGTGIILGLEFGTNWANYSWISGDIFGAPLAAEGIMAFFLESTFIAVMFFGWGKLSKKFHLVSIYLTAFGASLSALWILTANAWMNMPVGMEFNPDTARHEMVDFWAVLFSPYAVNKFLHTITSGFVISATFVIAISSWFLLKKRNILFAKRSIVIAATFGLLASIFIAKTGHGTGQQVANAQPAKLAAMEGLYEGEEGAGFVAVGLLRPGKQIGDGQNPYLFSIKVPKLLSFLSYGSFNAFVAGIDDIVLGNPEYGILSAREKIDRGKIALQALADYKAGPNVELIEQLENDFAAQKAELGELMLGDDQESIAEAEAVIGEIEEALMAEKSKGDFNKALFEENYRYMGYGHMDLHPLGEAGIIPHVPLVFYSFRIMIIVGVLLIIFFAVVLFLAINDKLAIRKNLLRIAIWAFPITFISSMAGWIVAEVGRQPWTIQGLLPTFRSTSNISLEAVLLTFWLFAAILTVLVIAEVKIMLTAIKRGPEATQKGDKNV